MRATRSGIAIGLALALLMPGSVVGQEAPSGTTVVPDPTSDLHAIHTMEPLDGPEYMDITQMTVEAIDSDLLVTFETAGDIPSELDPPATADDISLVSYGVLFDTDKDGVEDILAFISSADGWNAEMDNLLTSEVVDLGAAEIVANTAAIRVPLASLRAAPDVRFRGSMQATGGPDLSHPGILQGLEDRVPDDEDVWLALGEAAGPTMDAPTHVNSAALKNRVLGQRLWYNVEKESGVQGVTLKWLRKQVDRFLLQHADEFTDYRDPLEGQPLDRATFKWLFDTLKNGAPHAAKDGKAAKENSKLEVLGNYIYRLLFAYEYAATDQARDAAAELADLLFDYGVSQVRVGSPRLRAERIGISTNDLYDRAKE